MYDQSYNYSSLDKLILRGDFYRIPSNLRPSYRSELINNAISISQSAFEDACPIQAFKLNKKPAYKVNNKADILVLRKLSKNIRRFLKSKPSNRSRSTGSLIRILEENISYIIVRLDIKSFFESFSSEDLLKKIESNQSLNPFSKKQIQNLFKHFIRIGGSGIPRGLGLSSILSELMMEDFDEKLRSTEKVYFYTRYVDDIIIIAHPDMSDTILQIVKSNLPRGLLLNPKKSLPPILIGHDQNKSEKECEFLGYKFVITLGPKKDISKKRKVTVDISPSKASKIKKRITRAFIDFSRNNDFDLLLDRIKYLVSNFNLTDKNTGSRILAGLYYGYPLLTPDNSSLSSLDEFLKTLASRSWGRLHTKANTKLTGPQKRRIFGLSFVKGYQEKIFVNFSMRRIGEIQECWKHG